MGKSNSWDSLGWDTGAKKASCHESHSALVLGGGKILGASCSYPRAGFDVYVGLDGYMTYVQGALPWETSEKVITHVHYPIKDGHAPTNPARFLKLVEWLCTQLQEGKKIQVGCIGGHGRTGLLLAAIAAKLGQQDPIQWVRQHHCKKAVESQEQIEFLIKHYGATPVKPSKTAFTSTAITTSGGITTYPTWTPGKKQKARINPVTSQKSIWKDD